MSDFNVCRCVASNEKFDLDHAEQHLARRSMRQAMTHRASPADVATAPVIIGTT
jgi:hypothetical protein